MRLSKLYEVCSLQSCDPVYLLEVCRSFSGTYCPVLKADGWQWKRKAVGASETSLLVRCDSQKMVFSIVYIIAGSNFVAVLYCYRPPEECYAFVYCILCTLYCTLYTFWHVSADCLNFVCVVTWLYTPWICCHSINIHVAASWFGFLVLFLNIFIIFNCV